MTALSILKDTLFKLKKNEVRSLISFLKSNRIESKESNQKTILLVRLIFKNKECSSDQLQKLIYGKINYHAFNKLIHRLKEKILEVLTFDSNLAKSEYYGKRNQAVFSIRKKLLQSEIMFLRGLNDDLEIFHNGIIQKAKEFEVYDSLLTALYAKQRYLGFRFGSAKHSELKKEIEFYRESWAKVIGARESYSIIFSKISFSASSSAYMSELSKTIRELKKDYEKTKSATIGYHYLLLETEKQQNLNNVYQAQNILFQLHYLIENNSSVFTKTRMGAALLNLGINNLLLYRFENSIENIRASVLWFNEIRVNVLFAKAEEFYAFFYLGKHEKAEKLIEELYYSSRTSNTPFLFCKYAFLFAWLKTFNGNFAHSNELLREVKEIEKDKEGWNIGVRILSIINFIELEDFETADREIEKMKRHISKISTIKNIRKRYIVIQDVFMQLLKESYDFKKVYTNNKRLFKLLESKDEEYRWKIKSPEMLIFQEWFKSKAEARPYDFTTAIQKEKEKSLNIYKKIAKTTLTKIPNEI